MLKKKKESLKVKIQKLLEKGKKYAEIAAELKVKVEAVKAALKGE